MSNINYWERLTEKQIGMLDGLRQIYPNLPVHFYSYSFIVCPDRYVAGFYGFFNNWWRLHADYFEWGCEDISFYKVIDAKCSDYLKSMDIEHLQHIEELIINFSCDEEIDKVARQFLINKQEI